VPQRTVSQEVAKHKPPARRADWSFRTDRQPARRSGSAAARANAEELVNEIWSHLVRAIVVRKTELASKAADFEVTLQQVQLLKLIAQAEQPRTMSTLARLLACDASNITGLVDRLEARGLVLRGSNPKDRRITIITLTAAGDALMGQLAQGCFAPPAGLRRLKRSELGALRKLVLRAFPLESGSAGRSGIRVRKNARVG